MSVLIPLLLSTGGVGVAGLSWGLVEAHGFTVRQVTVPVLTPGAEPMRVLHLSDIHLTPRQRDKVEWLRSLADTAPHLVVNTGDNLAHARAVPALRDALSPLFATPGVYVNGSNDYFGPGFKNPLDYFRGPSTLRKNPAALPTADMERIFDGAGWLNLNNARGHLQIAGTTLRFTGLDDPHLRRDALPAPLAAAKGDAGETLSIGVVHAPYRRSLKALQDDGAQLIFAGHTHGGQVCLPGYGALVTNCDLDRRRVKGLSGWPGGRPDSPQGAESAWLHVSAGVGTSPFAPVRFACRPEATLLTLVGRAA